MTDSSFLRDFYMEQGISGEAIDLCMKVEGKLKPRFEEIDSIAEYNQLKVLRAMQKNRLAEDHLYGSTGYGYTDIGRDTVEKIYADVFHTEDALVRPQITCGTHALYVALSGNLRPGDEMLSIAGKVYDTLQGVIGIRPEVGSLAEFGITYSQVELTPEGGWDFDGIKAALQNEKIKLVDMVIELRDARSPLSSINPLLSELIGNKPRLIVLAKKDLADNSVTNAWLKEFEAEGHMAIAMDLLNDNAAKIISDACQKVMKEKIDKLKAKGLRHVEIKAMVVGIPNVGKSTLINSVSRKKMAKTANHPGVTRSLQWIKVSSDVALLDTPGVLWPKFEDSLIGYRLALCGSIAENVVPVDKLVRYALGYLRENYPDAVTSRYEVEMTDDVEELIRRIAQSRHFLNAEGKDDLERTELLVFRELKEGLLGRISWERPDETN